MYPYLGDFAAGSSIFVPFHTFSSAGASVALTGLAVTDIRVYKGASMTQRSSDAGFALVDTDGIDLDGVLGIHGFTIDTSDNTDASFYAAGNDYTVVVSSVTVDSQTVSFIACRFSIENRVSNVTKISGTAVSTTTAQLGVNVVQISTDATAADNLELAFDGTGYAGGTTPQQVVLTTSGVNAVADQVWDEAASGHVAAGSFGAASAIIRSGTAQAGASTTVTLDASASAVNDFYNNQRIFIVAGTGVGQGRIISGYVGATKVATVSSWATNPSSDSVFVILPFGSIPGATAPTAAEVADAVLDEALSGHTAEGSVGALFGTFHLHAGTAQAGAASTLTFDTAGSSTTTDFYKYNVLVIRGGTGAGQSRQITAYSTGRVATVSPSWTTTPDNTSEYVVIPLGVDAATLTAIADSVWDEARAGHVTAGTFGEYVNADTVRLSGDATAADNAEAFFDGTGYAGTNNVIPSVTTVTGNVNGNVGGNVSGSVNSVTGNLGGNVTGSVGSVTGNVGGNVVGSVASVTGNVGGNVVGSVASITAGVTLTNAGIDALYTRALTESYAADGAAPTVAQALMLIQQALTEFAISNTTWTVKKLDGTTTAATLTLNDATSPTSVTRAT